MSYMDTDEKILSHKKERNLPKTIPFYRVIMHNDDYTPMDFVVLILQDVFHKNRELAIHLMLQIHNTGSAMCGIYTKDVAATKIKTVHHQAEQEHYPLKCTMEPQA